MADSLIVNDGKKILLDRTYNLNPTRTPVSQFKIGMGTTDPVVANTAMETQVPITFTQVDDCSVTTGWTDSADLTLSVNTSVYKTGAGCLNFTKDAGTTVTVYSSKTTTSRATSEK